MKAITTLIFMISITGMVSPEASLAVSGEFEEVNGVRILHLWGDYQEMGFAHGFLLGDEIMEVVNDYMIPLIGAAAYQESALPAYRLWMNFPTSYLLELTGLRAGMIEAGTDIEITALHRDITVEDLCVMNCVVDLTQFMSINSNMDFACSSLNAWGAGTQSDPILPGGLIHCRDLDWSDTSDHLLGRRSVVIAYSPNAADTQNWFAVTFPGFIGCLSGMNQNGIGSTLNVGNFKVNPGSATNMVPICIQVRSALEQVDPNGDGKADAEDVFSTLESQSRAPSTIISAFGPSSGNDRLDPPALVVESNHTGIAKRLPSHDSELAPEFLAATNYHRVLYTSPNCWRYEKIKLMINDDRVVDSAEAWTIEREVHLAWTLQTMLFRPDIRELWFSSTINSTPAPFNTPAQVNWGDLFPGTATPTAEPGEPTNTPMPPTITPSPRPSTATPTPQPSETNPPTTPTATPTTAGDSMTLDLTLNASFFQAGNPFLLTYQIVNPTANSFNTALWIILDVYGAYWFFPSWTTAPEYEPKTIASGADTGIITVLDFAWPQTDSHAEGLRFWSALTDTTVFNLFSDVRFVEFGF